jgi:molybdopterin molybdotransferase
VNIAPGKPTLIGGCLKEKKLVIGLPGHPLSCSVVALTLVLPILYRMCGINNEVSDTEPGWSLLAEDVIGKSGVEEFIPAKLGKGNVRPLMAKSGYVGALREADTLILLDPSTETVRKGDSVQLWPL